MGIKSTTEGPISRTGGERRQQAENRQGRGGAGGLGTRGRLPVMGKGSGPKRMRKVRA